jgi:hypothetical protein
LAGLAEYALKFLPTFRLQSLRPTIRGKYERENGDDREPEMLHANLLNIMTFNISRTPSSIAWLNFSNNQCSITICDCPRVKRHHTPWTRSVGEPNGLPPMGKRRDFGVGRGGAIGNSSSSADACEKTCGIVREGGPFRERRQNGSRGIVRRPALIACT